MNNENPPCLCISSIIQFNSIATKKLIIQALKKLSTIFDLNQQILYEDEDILVINKPAGLLTIQDGYLPDLPHLTGLLKNKYGQIMTVHRLDRMTSGVILFARNSDAHRNLSLQFENRLIQKKYHTLAYGTPDWVERLVDLPLLINGDRKHRTVVSLNIGKPASTLLKVMGVFTKHSFIEATPHTGYTHQIRAHMAAIGFPLISDSLYAPKDLLSSLTQVIDRLALHAYHIQFSHPKTHRMMNLVASYPSDFGIALSNLYKA